MKELRATELRDRLAPKVAAAPFLPATRPGAMLAMDERLLLAPRADGIYFDVPEPFAFDDKRILDGGIAVLCLHGPIQHHTAWYWQSYEDLAKHVECALANESVRALVLKIDSPGGVAAGMSEAHRTIRRLSAKHGKPVLAYVDEMACSAAYHVASACDEIWGPPAMHVGSVGVILCTVDETAALDKQGIAVRYVVSGKRKADLHPGTAITDDVLAVAQAKVDILAGQFFHLVAKSRRRNTSALASSSAVEALQAAVFVGNDAVRAGLADGVASWPKFLDLVRRSISATPSMTDQSVTKANPARRAR